MSHAYHQGQRGYSPAQLLHSGCDECARRSRSVDIAIGHLDPAAFAAAWFRAAAYERGQLSDVCEAEVPVLRALWAVQCQMERLGVPIGTLPAGVPA